ncbi:hypothetical protein LPJ73_005423 [Coemansia sp. RSA 2703]|nr:hypothetical protein LPJ73_005423 [Coemansia sp. RSA 2703]
MDKFGMHSQTEQLFARHPGTGNADTTKHTWLTNQHLDTYAHIASNRGLTAYIAIAEGESVEETRLKMLRRMIEPCGTPPSSAEKDV